MLNLSDLPNDGVGITKPQHWGRLMMRKLLTALVIGLVGLLGLLGLGGVSSAQSLAAARPYQPPPVHCKIVINIKIVIVNGHVIIRGSGFKPNEHVNINVTFGQIRNFLNGGHPNGLRSSSGLSQLQAAETSLVPADESGSFATDVTLDQLGTATLTATGADSGQATSDDVEVLPVGSTIPAAAGADAGAGDSSSADSASNEAAGVTDSASQLAIAGTSLAGPIAIGAGVLFAGLAMLFFGARGVIRHKSSRSTPSM